MGNAIVCAHRPLHWPLQGGHHQAPERVRHARRGRGWIRCGWKLHVLFQVERLEGCRKVRHWHMPGEHADASCLLKRHRCQVRIDARLPDVRVADRRSDDVLGHDHVGHIAIASVGGGGDDLEWQPHILPGWGGCLPCVQCLARPAIHPLWRGHEGGREPGLYFAGTLPGSSNTLHHSASFWFSKRKRARVRTNRGRQTMRFASSVRTESTTPSQTASTRSRLGKDTGVRTRSLGCVKILFLDRHPHPNQSIACVSIACVCRTRGGGAGSRSRSRRRATQWCRSRWRHTRRWPSAKSREWSVIAKEIGVGTQMGRFVWEGEIEQVFFLKDSESLKILSLPFQSL